MNETRLVDLLASIDASLKTLVSIAQSRRSASATTAPSVDLDGQYGDPVAKFNPRDWNGAPCKGQHFSEIDPDCLELLAKAFDYFATKNADDPKQVKYNRLDAARARGWAARIRGGWKPQTTAASAHEPTW